MTERSRGAPRASAVERAFRRAANRAADALRRRGVPLRARVDDPVARGTFSIRAFEDELFELALEIGSDSRGEAVLLELGLAPYPGADVGLDGVPSSVRRVCVEERRPGR